MDKNRDYIPYGDEWKAEIKKLSKEQIIDLFANKAIASEKQRIESDTKCVNILAEADNEINELKMKNKVLTKAIAWALGIVGKFPTKEDGSNGNFYWRTELRERSGLTNDELSKF